MKQSRSRVDQERLGLASLADVLVSPLAPTDSPAQIWLKWASSSGVFSRGPMSTKNRWEDLSTSLGLALARPGLPSQPTPALLAFFDWARRAQVGFPEDEFRVSTAHACLVRGGAQAAQAAFEFFAAAQKTEGVDERSAKSGSLEEIWSRQKTIKNLRLDPSAVAGLLSKAPSCAAFLLRSAINDAGSSSVSLNDQMPLVEAVADCCPKFVIQRAFASMVRSARLSGGFNQPETIPRGFEEISNVLLSRGASWTEPVSASMKMSLLKDPSPLDQMLSSPSKNIVAPLGLAAVGPEIFWASAQKEFNHRLEKSLERSPSAICSDASSMAESLRDCPGMSASFALRLLQVACMGVSQDRPGALRQAFSALGDRLGARDSLSPWLIPSFAQPSASALQMTRQFNDKGWPSWSTPLPERSVASWSDHARSSNFWRKEPEEPCATGALLMSLMAKHGFAFPWPNASDQQMAAVFSSERLTAIEGWKIQSAIAPSLQEPPALKAARL
jgi:hypothetical protein